MKKILSLILALIMMLSTATMIFADEAIADETPVEVDETASAYYEAVKFLVNYDIMHGKGDTLGVYDDVKRYEAALFFGRILTGWTDDSTWEDGILNSSEFTDLAGTAAEAFYGAISYVNQMGVIEGYGDGKFGPEDGIRYQDLLAMATRALGYSEKYPWGCIQKAVELGLTDGITGVAYTDTLKREVVAQVIYNTLFAEKKAGGTLAKDVFDLDLAWTTVIITGTDKTTGVPAGYVSYSIVNADGTIGSDTFYAPAEQFGLTGEHDDEKAYAALYNVMFETTAEYGLNNVIAAESLELDTVVNAGIYSKTLAGYPIQVFLADYDIVTRYSEKTFLNAEPEIIIASVGLGTMDEYYIEGEFAIDWATGNILYRDIANTEVQVWLRYSEYHQWGDGWGEFLADPTNPVKFGLNDWIADNNIPDNHDGFCITQVDFADTGWDARYICSCGKWYDSHTELTDCLIERAATRVISYAPTSVLWYYNALIDSYFQIQFNDGYDEIAVTYMTEAEREYFFNNVFNSYVYSDWEEINTISKIESDAAKLNAYASLRVFDADKDSVADYGIYEEYRFGVVNTGMVVCNGKDCDGAAKAGYIFTDLSNYPIGGNTYTALEVIAETSCKHGTAWTDDEIVDGSYVIYGYNPATGEVTIVKTIAGAKENDDDADYVGTGYLRAFDAAKSTVTIDGEDYQYDYSNLKGSMTYVMNFKHGYDEDDSYLTKDGKYFNAPEYQQFLAVASRFLRTLYNQVVEFVVVDDKIVHMELSGASDDVIVVESYAGLHEDGTIVVWGYLVGASQTSTKLQQFRIASYNSWLMGDWYNYSWNYTDVIEAAFTTGTVYQIKSYDEDLKAYNVQVLSSMTDNEYDYTKGGVWTEIYYIHASVGLMNHGSEADGKLAQARAKFSDDTTLDHTYNGNIRKMADTDKYVFIYDVNKSNTVAPIVTYTGKVTDSDWYIKGWRVNGAVDGTYVFVIDGKYSDGTEAAIRGFGGAVDQGIGVVLFLEYGTKAAFDAENGRDYLVGSTVYTVHALDLVSGQFKEVVAYNGALRSPTITWTEAKKGLEHAGTKYVEWELGTEYAVLFNEDGTRFTSPASIWNYDEGYNFDWDMGIVATENGIFYAKEGSMIDGYTDNTAMHFAHVTNIKGYIYKTVNGVIVNDEPLTAAEAGKLLGDICATDADITTADYIGETGYVAARIDGSYQDEFNMLANGLGGSNEDAIGFNQYAINYRMTYDAFGVCYSGLSPYTIGRENARTVRIYGLRDMEKGRVQVELIGVNANEKVNSKNPFRNWASTSNDTVWEKDEDGDSCKTGEGAMLWFGDLVNGRGPDNQSYNYTMIYNCDRSNADNKKKNDKSYALVYIYDSNADELQPADEDDVLHGIND
ncbi:MAG: S-layer homology domain-containing protein [Ruminococcaceae bacterium]|nr:S-layer homology domain-containing protein [Oscillospiraceae bacterium]